MKQPGPDLLIKQLQEGKTAAFDRIYRANYYAIYSFARRFTGEDIEAEDITAETFVKFWQLRERFQNVSNIKAFLYLTARNACFDYLRFTKRKTQHIEEFQKFLQEDQFNNFQSHEIRGEVLSRIYRAIEELPQQCRQVIKLSFLEGLKNEEISHLMGISDKTVRNQKALGLKILRLAAMPKSTVISTTGALIYKLGSYFFN